MNRKIIFLALAVTSCNSTQKEQWKILFNGNDLTGWDTYLGRAYDTLQHKFDTLNIPGLNNDVENIFTVVTEDGKPAIRISGKHFGGITTWDQFSNYHLQLEFKWGTKKYPPKLNSKRDSGLLYHSVGPYGVDNEFWMRSQEFQIQEGDCGDFWAVAGTLMDIPATGDGVEKFVYDPSKELVTFNKASVNGRRCKINLDAEKPSGEWNVLDLYCLGDTSAHVVNGELVMMLYNSRQPENGMEVSLTKGKIQLQSEGAEIFYRNIKLQKIQALPSF